MWTSPQRTADFFTFTKEILNGKCHFCAMKSMASNEHRERKSRSSHSEVFLRKGVVKTCSKFTGEHPCGSAISIKLQSNFIEIAPWHGCSTGNFAVYFQNTFSTEHL